ncbi:disulfide bond formation protein B [Aromatoleum toluolicum]|uniref:Disulfide bond formation protein B n=1 Tax=Aromatoleum toluolicum TaxID=90060 RepID=A0ABX1NLL6_9RHOO|nr:disulfide bond formation protein B [Aromatoleum toluolicum]NMG00249.1 disulfide bond formation protein B [Aromatoleum toluolicum]
MKAEPVAGSLAGWTPLFGAWLVAASSLLGALFLGEVMELPPCVLCWWQRIAMFPLVLILPAGMFPLDRSVIRYALPLTLAGWLVALFHVLLVAGVIPERIQPCSRGVSCKEIQIEWFGFLTIPMLSLIAFTLIAGLLLFAQRRMSR